MNETSHSLEYEAFIDEARHVVEARFGHTGTTGEVPRLLLRHGTVRMARDMARGIRPCQVKMPDVSGLQYGDFTPLDPLALLRDEVKLPSLPAVVAELRDVLSSPNSSAADVARVISRDAGLSAFLLRMVNSAFYSFPSRIDTVSRAVALVGRQQLSTLALGVMVIGAMRDLPVAHLDLSLFWQHSIACAVVAGQLAEAAGMEEPERFFVAGLLHDIGRLAVFSLLPDRAAAILSMCSDYGMPAQDAELRVLGFDHATLGGMLLRKWNFPMSLVFSTLHHHVPERSVRHVEPAVVHVADVVVKGLGIGVSGMHQLPGFKEDAWQRLGVSVAVLEQLIDGLEERLRDTSSLLLE